MKTRWRRCLIRFLGWCIAAFASFIAVVLLVVATYLLFFDYSERLRADLERELSEIAGMPASIRSVNINMARYAFELRGIVVGAPGDEPLVEVERVWGRLRLSDILRLRLHWRELLVDGMSLRLVEDEPLARGRAPASGSAATLARAGFVLSADRIRFQDASLVVRNEEVPWELHASHLELSMTRRRRDHYRGTVSYKEGELRIVDHEPIDASVSAEFELEPGRLFVSRLAAGSPLGDVRAKGKVGFAGGLRGRFELTAESDASAVGTLFESQETAPELGGAITFSGNLELAPDHRSLEGTLAWPRGRLLGLPIYGFRGELLWDRSRLRLRDVRGRVAEGTATLELDQPLPVATHRASLELGWNSLPLDRIVREVEGRESPLDSLLSGSASLSFVVDRPREASGTFRLVGRPRPGSADGELGSVSLAVRSHGRLIDGDVDIEEALFETSTLRASLAGLYPRVGPADLAIEVVSTDLASTDRLQRELRRLARGDEEGEPELWGIAGAGEARGRLTDRLPHLRYEGELSADGLRFQEVNWGSLRARGQLSRERLSFEDLVARKDEGVVAGRGTLSLSGPLRERDFELDVRLSRWTASDVARFLDLTVDLEGVLSGQVSAARRGGGFTGSAELEIDDGALYQEAFERAEARLMLEGRRVRLEDVSVFREGVRIGGALTLGLDTGAMVGRLSTEDFPLQGTRLAGLGLQGRIDGALELAGSLERPVATLTGRGRDVGLAGVPLGETFLSGELRDGELMLEMTLEHDVSELALELSWLLQEHPSVSGRVRWRELDAAPWLGTVSQTLAESHRLLSNGEARFRARPGSSEPLVGLAVEATLAQAVLESDRYRFVSLAPVELRLTNGRLELPGMALSQGSSRVELGGTVDLLESVLDLRADGVVSLGVLESFYPSLATTGTVQLQARVMGLWERPSVNGHADLAGASIRYENFPQALGGLRGRLVFDNRTVRVPDLRAVFGSAPITITGAFSLEGLRPSSMDLQIRGRDIRLRYPEGLTAALDADLALLGNREEQVLSGELLLTDAVWSREYDLTSGILSDRREERLFEEFRGEELFEDLRFDITITAPESLRLRNSLASIDATAELELRGSPFEPVILGHTEAERGDIYFLGQRYTITSGKIDFVDPTEVQPFIDLTAETRVRSYRVELRLTGTPDRFHPELSSDPPLRTVEILRLLAGASERDISPIGNEEEELAGVGVASLLTERLSQEVGKRAQRLFGLDQFSIDPFLIGQFTNPTARVSLGKQITRELSVNYSSNLNATTEAIILIEYTPQGPMSWILSRDEEGDLGIDVKFRKSF